MTMVARVAAVVAVVAIAALIVFQLGKLTGDVGNSPSSARGLVTAAEYNLKRDELGRRLSSGHTSARETGGN